MHGKLLLSEVPIYRVSTLRNCFCEPSPSPIPAASLPGRAGSGEAIEKWPCSRAPHLPPTPLLVARGRGGGLEAPGPLFPRWRLAMGQSVCLKQRGPARERGGVCFDPRRGKPKSGGGGSGGQRGNGSPGPSARESCIDVAGRERSSRGAKQTEAPAGSGAQSVPGTWGPSRRGVNRKQMRRLLSPVSWSGSGRLRKAGTRPMTGPPDTSPPTPQ